MLECRRCKGDSGRFPKLYYKPIEDLGEHPALAYVPRVRKTKDLAKSKQIKKAYAGEKKQILKVANHLAKSTAGSGRFNQDGDAVHLNSLRIEHKERNYSNAVTVSKAELQKGEQQQIDVFEVFLVETNKTYYVLTEQTYLDLLSVVHCQTKKSA